MYDARKIEENPKGKGLTPEIKNNQTKKNNNNKTLLTM